MKLNGWTDNITCIPGQFKGRWTPSFLIDVRGIGLFSLIELVKNRETREPLVPWNATGPAAAMTKEINKRLLEGGVYTFVRWDWIFVAPPLVITEAELREGLKVIDQVLTYVDSRL
jgi:taurine--2-oxoglutarate transaminase